MGQTADRVSADREPRQLEREVATLRGELDELVDELGRRGRQVGRIVAVARAYAGPLSIAGALLVGGVSLRLLRRRRRPQPWKARLLAR